MQISIARTEGSNVELSQSLTDAKHETKRALEDTSHIRTQHLIDTTLTHSADRIGAQVTAAAVDTAYRAGIWWLTLSVCVFSLALSVCFLSCS